VTRYATTRRCKDGKARSQVSLDRLADYFFLDAGEKNLLARSSIAINYRSTEAERRLARAEKIALDPARIFRHHRRCKDHHVT